VTGPGCDPNGHCITCGDVAVEMRVIRVDAATGLALCESDAGEQETVEIALVPDARPAERLLIHAGTAIARGEAFC
jgi:hydrogenase maturation factor